MLHPLLNKALIQLHCSRIVLAKIHDISPTSPLSVFSVIFEEIQNDSIQSIKQTVINIPSSVLLLEFGNNKDKVVVANISTIKKNNLKCLAHLKTIHSEVIVNFLLYTHNYIWGILSFQYQTIPPYIHGLSIDQSYYTLMQYYRNNIHSSIL